MDVLITEGTNLTREDNYLTEEELAQQAGELMQQHKLIFAYVHLLILRVYRILPHSQM